MASTTGTATDHVDLYDKLISFLTTNPDLVAASQQWTKAWQHASGQRGGVIVAGPGLAGLDRVLVGLSLTGTTPADQTSGNFWIAVRGMTGVLTGATETRDHVNTSPKRLRMFLDNGPMRYWFMANGRRFMVVVKISTVFESMYAGLFLPYATPLQYRYPMFIGASAGEPALSPDNWRNLSDDHRSFPFAYSQVDTSSPNHAGQSWVLSPAGEWLDVSGTRSGAWASAVLHPNDRPQNYMTQGANGSVYASGDADWSPPLVFGSMRACYGGDMPLVPMQLVKDAPGPAVYGALDGAYRVAGEGNAAENIVTVDGVDYLVAQNAFRAGIAGYFALTLG